MCGLVGVSGNMLEADKKMFRDMLVFDQVRGFDSTGVALVRGHKVKDKESFVEIEKDLGAAQNLWEHAFPSAFNVRGIVTGFPRAMIGHNRAATIGKVTVENAHPFTFGDITGAHNGTLRHYSGLAGAATLDIDSKAVFNDIDINGIDHTWKSFFGAAALTYWDDAEETLNFVRNFERPLHYCYNKKKDVLYWASEEWMILAAAIRNKVDLDKDINGNVDIKSFKVDRLYTFKPKTTGIEFVGDRELEKKALPKQNYTVQAGFKNTTNSTQTRTKTTTSTNDIIKKARDFVSNRNWKDGTDKTDYNYKDLSIKNLRWIQRQGFKKGETEHVFRLDLEHNKKVIGFLDVCPTNKPEFVKFLRAYEEIRHGADYQFKLTDNPRIDLKGGVSTLQRFLCACSIVSFDKMAKVVDLHPPKPKLYLAPNGNSVYEKQMVAHLKEAGDACCYCTQTIDLEDANKLSWLSQKEALCPSCTKDWGGNLHMLYK